MTVRDQSFDNAVDAEILTCAARRAAFGLDQLRDHEWDPLVWNPGTAVYLLLARDFAPLPDRLRSSRRPVGGGSRAPCGRAGHASARCRGFTSRPRSDSSRDPDLAGRRRWSEALGKAEPLRREVESGQGGRTAALDEHSAWLRERLAAMTDGSEPERDPRIGAELFRGQAGTSLDAATDADAILARAEADLGRISERIGAVAAPAARASGRVRAWPGRCATGPRS